MARKALSIMKKAQLSSQKRAALYSHAVEHYHMEQAKRYPEKKLGFRGVCNAISGEHKKETGHDVKLCHNTLSNLVKGKHTMAEYSVEKRWLNGEEEEVMVKYIVKLGMWGWPLSYHRIKEHADGLARARLGTKFPELGVGVQWPYRFVKRHSDRLQSY